MPKPSGIEALAVARKAKGSYLKFRHHVQNVQRIVAEWAEGPWFDLSRNVRTFGDLPLRAAGVDAGQAADSEAYQPARPALLRKALRDLPVEDVSGFRYVDLGSGKGRSLFVAAEWPFRQIIGVEFSWVLHEQACENIRRFRRPRPGSQEITSLHANARDFEFPAGELVLYLFNPFGAATMQRVLENLNTARRLSRCRIFVILLWPQWSDQVAALEGVQLRRETKQYQIFEALPGCE